MDLNQKGSLPDMGDMADMARAKKKRGGGSGGARTRNLCRDRAAL